MDRGILLYLPSTNHRIYVVLGTPVPPFSDINDRAWSRALEFGCEIGRGATTGADLVTRLTTGLWKSDWRTKSLCYIQDKSSRYLYNPGVSPYIDAETPVYSLETSIDYLPDWKQQYDFTEALRDFSTAGDDPMQCNNVSGWIQLQARMQGHRVVGIRIEDFAYERRATPPGYTVFNNDYMLFLKTHVLYPAGSVATDSWNFTFHEVVSSNANAAASSPTYEDYAFFVYNPVHDASVSANSGSPSANPAYLRRFLADAFSTADRSRDSLFRLITTRITEVK